jgi:hypothetical protein
MVQGRALMVNFSEYPYLDFVLCEMLDEGEMTCPKARAVWKEGCTRNGSSYPCSAGTRCSQTTMPPDTGLPAAHILMTFNNPLHAPLIIQWSLRISS